MGQHGHHPEKEASLFSQRPVSSRSEQQSASNKDNKVILIPLSHRFCGNGGFEKPRAPGREGEMEDHLEVLLSSLLGIHCIQDGLPLGGVALPELLNLPLHHGIQGTQPHL